MHSIAIILKFEHICGYNHNKSVDYKLLKLLRMIKLLKLRLPSRLYKLISDGGGEDIVLFCVSVYNFEKCMFFVA